MHGVGNPPAKVARNPMAGVRSGYVLVLTA
jgi:hypothetical protein